jgi:hypothetical protein
MKFRLIVECDVELPDNVHDLEQMGFELDKVPGPDSLSVEEQVRSQQEHWYKDDFGMVVDQCTFNPTPPTIKLTYHND